MITEVKQFLSIWCLLKQLRKLFFLISYNAQKLLNKLTQVPNNFWLWLYTIHILCFSILHYFLQENLKLLCICSILHDAFDRKQTNIHHAKTFSKLPTYPVYNHYLEGTTSRIKESILSRNSTVIKIVMKRFVKMSFVLCFTFKTCMYTDSSIQRLILSSNTFQFGQLNAHLSCTKRTFALGVQFHFSPPGMYLTRKNNCVPLWTDREHIAQDPSIYAPDSKKKKKIELDLHFFKKIWSFYLQVSLSG